MAFVSASSFLLVGSDLRLIWLFSMPFILRILATKGNDLSPFSLVGGGIGNIMARSTGEVCGTPLGNAIEEMLWSNARGGEHLCLFTPVVKSLSSVYLIKDTPLRLLNEETSPLEQFFVISFRQ